VDPADDDMNHRFRLGRGESASFDHERGAALILALAVMMAIGGVLAGLSYFISTSTRSSIALEATRDELYAADGAVESAIRAVQQNTNGLLGSTCPSQVVSPFVANGEQVWVTCAGEPATTISNNQVVIERNVVLTACAVEPAAGACPANAVLIRAKVNFPTNAAGVVTGAFVQSWSVRP
jgi:hypothetical protein